MCARGIKMKEILLLMYISLMSWGTSIVLYFFSFPKKCLNITKKGKKCTCQHCPQYTHKKPHSHSYRMFINFCLLFPHSQFFFVHSTHQFTWRHKKPRNFMSAVNSVRDALFACVGWNFNGIKNWVNWFEGALRKKWGNFSIKN